MYEKVKSLNKGFREVDLLVKSLEERFIKKANLKISRKELLYLVALREYEGEMLQNTWKHLGVTKPTFSTQLKLLVQKGFIIIYSNDKDKRIKHARLTEKGNKICDIHGEIRKKITDAFETHVTEKELSEMTKTGYKIISALEGVKI